MVYRVLGLMSGSSMDGLDLCYVHLHETSGKWNYQMVKAVCYPYPESWIGKLRDSIHLSAREYLLLHTEFGHYIGKEINRFIQENELQFQIQLIASHGHTTFHIPGKFMTAQLGDGAAIAAETGINVVSDLRAMDVALGGQGAPVVPIGEKLLLGEYDFFLNLGGIANLSVASAYADGSQIAFDVCPANRVLNMLANEVGLEYDEGGQLASSGTTNELLLARLNELEYYRLPYPKSLANDFGTDVIYPLIKDAVKDPKDGMRIMIEHIVFQISAAVRPFASKNREQGFKLLVTGGGAFNQCLVSGLTDELGKLNVEVVIPEKELIQYKEALIMALMGVLRWREENNVLASVTGARRHSIGGAVWMGQEA